MTAFRYKEAARCNNKNPVMNVWTNSIIQTTGQWVDGIYTWAKCGTHSIPTVTSLKLTKRVARYLRRQQQQVLVEGDWPRCARTRCWTPGWGINDWKIPGERFEWVGTYSIIQFSRGRGESNNERNVDIQFKCKIGRTQCRKTLETSWVWDTWGTKQIPQADLDMLSNSVKY